MNKTDKNICPQVYVFQYRRQNMNKYTNEMRPLVLGALEKNKAGKVAQK